MNLTTTEQQFVLWAFAALLGILAFIGSLGVNALIKMAKDINEIKVSVTQQAAKHEGLEKRVDGIDEELKYLHNKIFPLA